jgi:hypothetical protein
LVKKSSRKRQNRGRNFQKASFGHTDIPNLPIGKILPSGSQKPLHNPGLLQ